MDNIKPIPGQPGYWADSDGSIWSEKNGTHRQLRSFRRGRRGHLAVNLCQKGIYRMYSLHRLVAVTFIGEPPTPSHQVMHGDDDPANNALRNLSYGLPRENSAQMVDRKRQARGERIPWSKLTQVQADEIRRRLAAGETGQALAAVYGVSRSVISAIKKNHIWRKD